MINVFWGLLWEWLIRDWGEFLPVLPEAQIAVSCDEYAGNCHVASISGCIHGEETRVEGEIVMVRFGWLGEYWGE